MKLATFNINGINKRLANLLSWLDVSRPEIVCLQELKSTDRQFPASALADAGYGAVWAGEPNWNGVAILARGLDPVVTRTTLPGDQNDQQARYIEAAVDGTIVGCLYAPNGNPQPGPKFSYKLGWHQRFSAHAEELLDSGLPVILAGDFNIVPEPRDIYVTTSYKDNALLQPQARASYAELLGQGWIDTVRHTHPDEVIYSFWDYRRQRWERNAGLRLDHILIPPKLRSRLKATGVDRDVRAGENASDHAPVWAQFDNPKPKASRGAKAQSR